MRRALRERRHRDTCWLRGLFVWVGLSLALLGGCGLEPRYVLPPPESNDGTFRWVDALDVPPADYLPVTFADPASGRQIAVCRGFIVDDIDQAQGYHTGELVIDAGEPACWVPHRGGLLRFARRDNAYQQLWARAGAAYSWVAIDTIPERPLTLSAIWQNNRLPSNYVRRLDSGAPFQYWTPCAAQVDGAWHLGKLGMQDNVLRCYIQLDQRETLVTTDVRVLYAPVH
ncbi:hypothetical protein EKD04_011760 [Chloroflexales bacterium ZM16-3]|nr:hypothetical protein [Chloroflexales bacterium ZM16-3]